MTVRSLLLRVIPRQAIRQPGSWAGMRAATSASGTHRRGCVTVSGRCFSSTVTRRSALPPSEVAQRWSYWCSSFASYSGR